MLLAFSTNVSVKNNDIAIVKIRLIKPKAIKLVLHPKNSARNPPKIKQEIGIIAIIAVIFDISFGEPILI